MEAQVARFWSRVFALFIDSILLGIVGLVLGAFLFDFFVQLGPWGRLLGFAVALLYFGFLNSGLGGGQTLGKKWLKLKVVNLDGSHLSLGKSAVRFTILGIPYFLNGISLPAGKWEIPLMIVLVLLIFGLGFGILYLYLANRRTRQSLHDIICGTCVVKSASQGALAQKVWKGHFAWLVILLLLLTSGVFFAKSQLEEHFDYEGMLALQAELNALEFVNNSGVRDQWNSVNGQESRHLVVSVLVKKKLDHEDVEFLQIAQTVAATYPEVFEKDSLVVSATYGYDIGIASGHFSTSDQFGIPELRELMPAD